MRHWALLVNAGYRETLYDQLRELTMVRTQTRPGEHTQFHRFQTDDGLEIRVRQEQPEDGHILVDLFQNLGPTSRYNRFAKVLDAPDSARVAQEAERLARLEPPHDVAWLAFADLPDRVNTPVAAARYMRRSPEVAELAVVVRDDLQNRGVGSQLLNYVLQQAKADGVCDIVATFHGNNRAVWRLLSYSPFHVTWQMKGPQVDVVIHLQPKSSVGSTSSLS
jgi:acetyltransferase